MKVIYPITVTPDVLVSSSIPVETTYPAFSVGTTYNTGDRVILDGQAVYECLADGVVGALPISDTQWVIVRPTNRWAMFDQLPSTSRQQSDTLTITLAVPAVGDVMLLGIVAASVTVTLPDVTRTVTLATNTEQSVYITGLASAGGNLTITIQPVVVVTSLILRVAEILVGTVRYLGETQYGAGVEISDYSTRTIDEYGNANFIRRGYSNILQARFTLERDKADTVLDTITALRAVPCVWIGSQHYQCAVIYGYYREASMEIRESLAQCSMRIESLAVDTLSGTISGGGGGGGPGGGGWWGDWTGWDQPVIPPAPAGDVVLLVRGESWPLVDASPLNRAVSADSSILFLYSPPLFGSETSMRCAVFASPSYVTAVASAPVIADGDFCAESFVYIRNNANDGIIHFKFGTILFSALGDGSDFAVLRIRVNNVTVSTVYGAAPRGQWLHIAWARKDGVISVYVSGVRAMQYAYADAIDMTTALVGRGQGFPEGSQAYIKYARITVGDSVYSGASFPPLTSGY